MTGHECDSCGNAFVPVISKGRCPDCGSTPNMECLECGERFGPAFGKPAGDAYRHMAEAHDTVVAFATLIRERDESESTDGETSDEGTDA